MKTVSLNGKWSCKADVENIGIKNKWYDIKSYNASDNHLVVIEIPKSFNLLKIFKNFEGIFWHYYQFELNEEIDTINKYDYQIRFKG